MHGQIDHNIIPLTENDPKWWDKPYVYQPYPAMRYRPIVLHGKADVEHCTVQNAREDQALDANWHDTPTKALAQHERLQEDIARAAAQAAGTAATMSATAQREYAQASSDSPEHVTDVVGERRPGRPKKSVEG